MSTQEAVLVVLVVAIFANLVMVLGLVLGPWLRARREASEAEKQSAATPPNAAIPRALGTGRPSPRLVASVTAVPDSVEGDGAVPGFGTSAEWSKWLAEEGARVDRYRRPATIVLVELAGLDRLVERLGPEAADRLTVPIATTLRRQARASDNLARLGQAKFGSLLIETDEVRAINYVERVRSACDVWLESGAVTLRLAIGWAEIGANQPVEIAIQAAERRLNEERQRLRARPEPSADGETDADAASGPERGPDVQASVMRSAEA